MKLFSFVLGIIIFVSFESSLIIDFQKLLQESSIHFPQKEGIIILTTETIEEAIKTYPKLAILMYAPWCPHCKALYPEIVKSLKSNEMKKMGLVFGRVDIEYNSKVAENYKVYGMPTILYFENGKRKETYGGGRNSDAIIEWFYKRIVSKEHVLNSLDEIKNYENPEEKRFIYFGNESQNLKEYEKFIDQERDIIYGWVKDYDLIKKYGKNPETVVLYKNFDDPPYVEIKNITSENLKKELDINAFPLIYDDCDQLMKVMFNKRIPAILLLRNGNDTQKTPNLDESFLSLAIKNRGTLQFCKSDLNSDFSKRIIRVANITKANAEKNEPTAVILDFVKGFNKWKFENFYTEFNNDNLKLFLQTWIDGKMKPPIRSEEIPESQEGPVYKLVNKSFKKEVMDNDLNVFVKFYSPNCPHCIKLKPNYEKLAENLKYNKNVRIAEYNLKENDFDEFQIRGYPTLVLFKAGEKDKHITYRGNRTVEDMMNFVISNLGNTEEIIKKKEEQKKKLEEEAKRKRKEEEEKKRKEEEEKKRKEEEEKKRKEEEEKKKKLEEEAKRKEKEEEDKRKKKEEEKKKKLEEGKNKKLEEEAKRKKIEEEKKKKLEEEAKRKKIEEEKKKKLEEEKKKKEEKKINDDL